MRDLIDALIKFAPPPRNQTASTRAIEASEPAMTGIVFKIQANMDPNHRDRIAFMRVCSGKLTRGMKVKVVRTGKVMALTAPQFFFAQDRSIAEEAYAGDVVGIPNRGALRIGDALTEGEDMTFLGIPSFAPEILRRIRLDDAIKASKLARPCRRWRKRAWCSCSSPSTARSPSSASLARCSSTCWPIASCTNTACKPALTRRPATRCAGLRSNDPAAISRFVEKNRSAIAMDLDGAQVFLATSAFNLSWTAERNPEVQVRRHQDDDGLIIPSHPLCAAVPSLDPSSTNTSVTP